MSMAAKQELSYSIEASKKAVFIESDFYIPFEPNKSNPHIRDLVLGMQKDLKSALSQLVLDDGEILFATYSENDKSRFYDVENMLFYNVGTSAFSGCCKQQLAFMGDIERFAQEQPSDLDERYHYAYRVASVKEISALLSEKRILAHWQGLPIETSIPQSATRYYSAIRKNIADVHVNEILGAGHLFGISLDITLPTKCNPASVMKPALDGIICAFHGEADGVAAVLEKLFGGSLTPTNQDSKRLNLFGVRNYVSQYRGANSFKWNPEDEHLQFAWIRVHKGSQAEVSGKVYEW